MNYKRENYYEKIEKLEQKRQSIIVLHNTFMKLNKILWEDCEIDLKKDLEPFTKLFSDFKENGYDVTSIVEEYNKAIKSKVGYNTERDPDSRSYEKQLTSLHNNINFISIVF